MRFMIASIRASTFGSREGRALAVGQISGCATGESGAVGAATGVAADCSRSAIVRLEKLAYISFSPDGALTRPCSRILATG